MHIPGPSEKQGHWTWTVVLIPGCIKLLKYTKRIPTLGSGPDLPFSESLPWTPDVQQRWRPWVWSDCGTSCYSAKKFLIPQLSSHLPPQCLSAHQPCSCLRVFASAVPSAWHTVPCFRVAGSTVERTSPTSCPSIAQLCLMPFTALTGKSTSLG